MKNATYRVLLVEDSPSIRQMFRQLMGDLDSVEIIGEADTVKTAEHLIATTEPDAAVVDLFLADGVAFDLIRNIKRAHPGCMVMVVTSFAVEASRERAVAMGADQFFEKTKEVQQMIGELASLAEFHRMHRVASQ